MTPPLKLEPFFDRHSGFTAEITSPKQGTYTLWRPGCVLKTDSPQATLQSYNEKSFYQLNNDVTIARYRVKGYRYIVVVWFDNQTGTQIA